MLGCCWERAYTLVRPLPGIAGPALRRSRGSREPHPMRYRWSAYSVPQTKSDERREVMKVKDVMTRNPVCCVPGDTAQRVAKIMCEHNVGSIPVVVDQQSQKLTGIITDRDLCCSIVAEGLDP